MTTMILKDIPFVLRAESLKSRLRIREGGTAYIRFLALIEEAQKIARPKVMYRPVYIEDRTEEAVKVEGQWFRSRVLSVNLIHAHRIFIFVATCGVELDEWARGQQEVLKAFWADAVKEIAVRTAVKALEAHIETQYHPGQISRQLPGSLEDFPLAEQEVLFALMGDTKAAVGVTMLSSLMMSPSHSVSGIIFPTTENFESCLLCPRYKCPGRRAPYDQTLYERKYSKPAEATGP